MLHLLPETAPLEEDSVLMDASRTISRASEDHAGPAPASSIATTGQPPAAVAGPGPSGTSRGARAKGFGRARSRGGWAAALAGLQVAGARRVLSPEAPPVRAAGGGIHVTGPIPPPLDPLREAALRVGGHAQAHPSTDPHSAGHGPPQPRDRHRAVLWLREALTQVWCGEGREDGAIHAVNGTSGAVVPLALGLGPGLAARDRWPPVLPSSNSSSSNRLDAAYDLYAAQAGLHGPQDAVFVLRVAEATAAAAASVARAQRAAGVVAALLRTLLPARAQPLAHVAPTRTSRRRHRRRARRSENEGTPSGHASSGSDHDVPEEGGSAAESSGSGSESDDGAAHRASLGSAGMDDRGSEESDRGDDNDVEMQPLNKRSTRKKRKTPRLGGEGTEEGVIEGGGPSPTTSGDGHGAAPTSAAATWVLRLAAAVLGLLFVVALVAAAAGRMLWASLLPFLYPHHVTTVYVIDRIPLMHGLWRRPALAQRPAEVVNGDGMEVAGEEAWGSGGLALARAADCFLGPTEAANSAAIAASVSTAVPLPSVVSQWVPSPAPSPASSIPRPRSHASPLVIAGAAVASRCVSAARVAAAAVMVVLCSLLGLLVLLLPAGMGGASSSARHHRRAHTTASVAVAREGYAAAKGPKRGHIISSRGGRWWPRRRPERDDEDAALLGTELRPIPPLGGPIVDHPSSSSSLPLAVLGVSPLSSRLPWLGVNCSAKMAVGGVTVLLILLAAAVPAVLLHTVVPPVQWNQRLLRERLLVSPAATALHAARLDALTVDTIRLAAAADAAAPPDIFDHWADSNSTSSSNGASFAQSLRLLEAAWAEALRPAALDAALQLGPLGASIASSASTASSAMGDMGRSSLAASVFGCARNRPLSSPFTAAACRVLVPASATTTNMTVTASQGVAAAAVQAMLLEGGFPLPPRTSVPSDSDSAHWTDTAQLLSAAHTHLFGISSNSSGGSRGSAGLLMDLLRRRQAALQGPTATATVPGGGGLQRVRMLAALGDEQADSSTSDDVIRTNQLEETLLRPLQALQALLRDVAAACNGPAAGPPCASDPATRALLADMGALVRRSSTVVAELLLAALTGGAGASSPSSSSLPSTPNGTPQQAPSSLLALIDQTAAFAWDSRSDFPPPMDAAAPVEGTGTGVGSAAGGGRFASRWLLGSVLAAANATTTSTFASSLSHKNSSAARREDAAGSLVALAAAVATGDVSVQDAVEMVRTIIGVGLASATAGAGAVQQGLGGLSACQLGRLRSLSYAAVAPPFSSSAAAPSLGISNDLVTQHRMREARVFRPLAALAASLSARLQALLEDDAPPASSPPGPAAIAVPGGSGRNASWTVTASHTFSQSPTAAASPATTSVTASDEASMTNGSARSPSVSFTFSRSGSPSASPTPPVSPSRTDSVSATATATQGMIATTSASFASPGMSGSGSESGSGPGPATPTPSHTLAGPRGADVNGPTDLAMLRRLLRSRAGLGPRLVTAINTVSSALQRLSTVSAALDATTTASTSATAATAISAQTGGGPFAAAVLEADAAPAVVLVGASGLLRYAAAARAVLQAAFEAQVLLGKHTVRDAVRLRQRASTLSTTTDRAEGDDGGGSLPPATSTGLIDVSAAVVHVRKVAAGTAVAAFVLALYLVGAAAVMVRSSALPWPVFVLVCIAAAAAVAGVCAWTATVALHTADWSTLPPALHGEASGAWTAHATSGLEHALRLSAAAADASFLAAAAPWRPPRDVLADPRIVAFLQPPPRGGGGPSASATAVSAVRQALRAALAATTHVLPAAAPFYCRALGEGALRECGPLPLQWQGSHDAMPMARAHRPLRALAAEACTAALLTPHANVLAALQQQAEVTSPQEGGNASSSLSSSAAAGALLAVVRAAASSPAAVVLLQTTSSPPPENRAVSAAPIGIVPGAWGCDALSQRLLATTAAVLRRFHQPGPGADVTASDGLATLLDACPQVVSGAVLGVREPPLSTAPVSALRVIAGDGDALFTAADTPSKGLLSPPLTRTALTSGGSSSGVRVAGSALLGVVQAAVTSMQAIGGALLLSATADASHGTLTNYARGLFPFDSFGDTRALQGTSAKNATMVVATAARPAASSGGDLPTMLALTQSGHALDATDTYRRAGLWVVVAATVALLTLLLGAQALLLTS